MDEAFAQSIRKDLTLEELTKEVETAVMEESGTSKKDVRNRQATRNAFTGVACGEQESGQVPYVCRASESHDELQDHGMVVPSRPARGAFLDVGTGQADVYTLRHAK